MEGSSQLNKFLEAVPKADDWDRRLAEHKLHTPEARNFFVHCALAPEQPQFRLATTPEQHDGTLKGAARVLVSSTHQRFDAKKEQDHHMRVRIVILLSFLHVLQNLSGEAWSDTNKSIEWIATQEQSRKSMFNSVWGLHQSARSLVRSGWDEYRVAELFVLCTPSPSGVRKLVGQWETLEQHLQNPDDPDTSPNRPGLCGFQFTLPGLVHHMIWCSGTVNITLSAVRRALGYEGEELPPEVRSAATSQISVDRQFFVNVPLPQSSSKSKKSRKLIAPKSLPSARNGSVRQIHLQSVKSGTKKTVGDRSGLRSRCGGTFPQQRTSTIPSRPCNDIHNRQSWQATVLRRPPEGHSATSPTQWSCSRILVALLQQMGCREVPQEILLRGARPQRKWSPEGAVIQKSLVETEMSQQCLALFQSEQTVKDVIGQNLASGNLQCSDRGEGLILSCTEEDVEGSSELYRTDALLLLCHAFPLEEALERGSTKTVDDLLPALERWSIVLGDEVPSKRPNLSKNACESVVETYAAAAARRNRIQFLEVATQYAKVGVSPHLSMAIARTSSVFARRRGDFAISDRIVDDALPANVGTSDILSRALRKELLLSKAENAMLQKQFDSARNICEALLQEDKPNVSPTDLEFTIKRKLNTVLGRIYHNLGEFGNAENCFNVCRQFCEKRSDRVLPHLTRHLANTLMEQERYSEAEAIVRQELEKCWPRTKATRRLKLCYGTALLALGRNTESHQILSEADEHFRHAAPRDQSDELDHIHTRLKLLILDQLASRWDQLIARATDTIILLHTYNSFRTAHFYHSRTLALRAGAYLELARTDLQAISPSRHEVSDSMFERFRLLVPHQLPAGKDHFTTWAADTMGLLQPREPTPVGEFCEGLVLVMRAELWTRLARLDLSQKSDCDETPVNFIPGAGTHDYKVQEEWLRKLLVETGCS